MGRGPGHLQTSSTEVVLSRRDSCYAVDQREEPSSQQQSRFQLVVKRASSTTSKVEIMRSPRLLTVLHISDTQFGKNHLFGNVGLTLDDQAQDLLQSRMREDLAKLREKHKVVPDAVVISGDISEWGKESEFKQAKRFLEHILSGLGLSRMRIALIPGNHDVNRAACDSYFKTCDADEIVPKKPYWPKLRHYTQFFSEFYNDIPGYKFTEERPWSLFEIPELNLVIAGLNSTMAESHLDVDHYGFIGEAQLNWFVEQLKQYKAKGWYRVAVVHHNINREYVSDVEYLRDEQDLKRLLGPHINMLLHGHTHVGQIAWLNQHVPILSTGSSGVIEKARPEEIPNQYQIIQISARAIRIFSRAYDTRNHRWIGDNRVSDDGSTWQREEPCSSESSYATFGQPTTDQARVPVSSHNIGSPKNPASTDGLIVTCAPTRNQKSLSEYYLNVINQVSASSNLILQYTFLQDTPGIVFQDSLKSKLAAIRYLIADITFLNFNIAYVIGYCLAKGRKLFLIKNRSADRGNYPAMIDADEVENKTGIFESIYTLSYSNPVELVDKLKVIESLDLTSAIFDEGPNLRVPVYLVEKSYRGDDVIRLVSTIKKTIHYFRSFDPNEQIRLSLYEAVAQVTPSIGVIVQLASSSEESAEITNLRAAFVAGLTAGLGRELLFLQPSDGPIPREHRFAINTYETIAKLESMVRSFAQTVVSRKIKVERTPNQTDHTDGILSNLYLGASCAENEFQELSQYYVKTYEFERALKGDVRLVVGRKGSGKTALFAQVRDKIRANKKHVVIDLKPDGYQIRKFNEQVLEFLEEGTKEHTITAFWEYLLLLESCYKILEKDEKTNFADPRLQKQYDQLSKLYRRDEYLQADFSERTNRLTDGITKRFNMQCDASDRQIRLSRSDITQFLYSHDVQELRNSVAAYLKLKEGLWILFDNLDKGWSTHGVTKTEALSIRCLLDASRKLDHDLQRAGVECHTLVFIRNDVYDWLVEETPDRGKEAIAELDWKEPDELRELLRRRLVYSGLPDTHDFHDLWTCFCTPTVDGTESSQYIIDRCLMRPRFLLDLVSLCRSTATNRRHKIIEPDDIRRASNRYSKDIVYNINYEIEDVFPKAKKLLYLFHGSSAHLSREDLVRLLESVKLNENESDRLIDILLWQGVLGVSRDSDDRVIYIYSVQYDINKLKGIIINAERAGIQAFFYINPAFWPHLEIK